ncbi:MAG: hypothetical protein AAGH78_01040 [Cyanobacteria bacterium P01_H01_bin.58]
MVVVLVDTLSSDDCHLLGLGQCPGKVGESPWKVQTAEALN